MYLLRKAELGATTSIVADIGKRARPVWRASRLWTDCKKTGIANIKPVIPNDNMAITLEPTANWRFLNKLSETSGVRPLFSIFRCHQAKTSNRNVPANRAYGVGDKDPGT